MGIYRVDFVWRNKFGETTPYSADVEFTAKKVGNNLSPLLEAAAEQAGLTKLPLNEASAVGVTVRRLPEFREYVVTGGSASTGGSRVKATSPAEALTLVEGGTHVEVAPPAA